MPRILNTSKRNVELGFHPAFPPNTTLIQIVSTGEEFPTPASSFSHVHQFRFLDVDDEDEVLSPDMRFSNAQAREVILALQLALKEGRDVLVHCEAGVSRSRAVAEIGQMMGFEYLGPEQGSPNSSIRRTLWAMLYQMTSE